MVVIDPCCYPATAHKIIATSPEQWQRDGEEIAHSAVDEVGRIGDVVNAGVAWTSPSNRRRRRRGRRSSSRSTASRQHGERLVRGGGVDDRRQWRHERRHGTHRAGPRQHQCVESTAQAPTTNRPESAGTAPNSGELGFLRSGTSTANRANRPGWQSRSAKSGAFATDGGGQRRRSRTKAAVSGKGGVGVEQGSAR
jgi:hypothetical protein